MVVFTLTVKRIVAAILIIVTGKLIGINIIRVSFTGNSRYAKNKACVNNASANFQLTGRSVETIGFNDNAFT